MKKRTICGILALLQELQKLRKLNKKLLKMGEGRPKWDEFVALDGDIPPRPSVKEWPVEEPHVEINETADLLGKAGPTVGAGDAGYEKGRQEGLESARKMLVCLLNDADYIPDWGDSADEAYRACLERAIDRVDDLKRAKEVENDD